jgi:hypothetical protein
MKVIESKGKDSDSSDDSSISDIVRVSVLVSIISFLPYSFQYKNLLLPPFQNECRFSQLHTYQGMELSQMS